MFSYCDTSLDWLLAHRPWARSDQKTVPECASHCRSESSMGSRRAACSSRSHSYPDMLGEVSSTSSEGIRPIVSKMKNEALPVPTR